MIDLLTKTKDGIEIDMELVEMNKYYLDLFKRSRCKWFKGDSEGRDKLRAKLELKYIYHMHHPNAEPSRRGMNTKEAMQYSYKVVGMPEEWSEDEIFELALTHYKDHIESLIKTATFKTLIKTIRGISKTVDKLTKLTAIELEVELTDDKTAIILDRQVRLLKLISDVPSKLKSLELAEEQSKLEMKQVRKMRGGGEVPDSAIPSLSL